MQLCDAVEFSSLQEIKNSFRFEWNNLFGLKWICKNTEPVDFILRDLLEKLKRACIINRIWTSSFSWVDAIRIDFNIPFEFSSRQSRLSVIPSPLRLERLGSISFASLGQECTLCVYWFITHLMAAAEVINSCHRFTCSTSDHGDLSTLWDVWLPSFCLPNTFLTKYI